MSATKTFSGSKRRITVPIERSLRTPIGNFRPYLRGGPTQDESRSFADLASKPIYDDLRGILSTYIAKTIHDPVRLQGLWTLSIAPSTSGDTARLFTLSVGGTETFYVLMTDVAPVIRLNVADIGGLATALDGLDKNVWQRQARYTIRRHCPVRSMEIWGDVDLAARLLQRSDVLDAAYRLNAYLMRYGGTQLASTHNRAFAESVLWPNGRP